MSLKGDWTFLWRKIPSDVISHDGYMEPTGFRNRPPQNDRCKGMATWCSYLVVMCAPRSICWATSWAKRGLWPDPTGLFLYHPSMPPFHTFHETVRGKKQQVSTDGRRTLGYVWGRAHIQDWAHRFARQPPTKPTSCSLSSIVFKAIVDTIFHLKGNARWTWKVLHILEFWEKLT